MAYIPRSSFIPKDTTGAIPVQMRRRRTVHVFGLLGTILFSLAFVGSLVIFFYNDYLAKNLEQAKQDLSGLSTRDSAEKIEQIAAYDRKLAVARELLERHIAPTKLFEELELSTKGTVQFTSFNLEHDPGFKVLLSLGGVTEDFASVALQKMQFGEDALFSEYVVKDIARTSSVTEGETEGAGLSEEKISFMVTGLFNPEFIGYSGDAEEAPVTLPETPLETTQGEESVSSEVIPATESLEESDVIDSEPMTP